MKKIFSIILIATLAACGQSSNSLEDFLVPKADPPAGRHPPEEESDEGDEPTAVKSNSARSVFRYSGGNARGGFRGTE